jgi:predicted ester cyclase
MTASTTNGGAEVAIVRRFIDEVINGGQLDLVDALWSEDLAWHGGSLGEIHGLASYKAFLRAAAEGAFSGMHLTVHDVVAADGKVAVRFTNSGTHTGTFMGAPATGKRAESWSGGHTVVAGKITEAWFGEDVLGMTLQLGVVHLPPR